MARTRASIGRDASPSTTKQQTKVAASPTQSMATSSNPPRSSRLRSPTRTYHHKNAPAPLNLVQEARVASTHGKPTPKRQTGVAFDASETASLSFESARSGFYIVSLASLAVILRDAFSAVYENAHSNGHWLFFYCVLALFFVSFSAPLAAERIASTYTTTMRIIVAWAVAALVLHLPPLEDLGLAFPLTFLMYTVGGMIMGQTAFHIIFTLAERGWTWLAHGKSRITKSLHSSLRTWRATGRSEVLIICENALLGALGCTAFYAHCEDATPAVASLLRKLMGGEAMGGGDSEIGVGVASVKKDLCSMFGAAPLPVMCSDGLWAYVGLHTGTSSSHGQPMDIQYYHPVFTLWLTLIAIYAANYIQERFLVSILSEPVKISSGHRHGGPQSNNGTHTQQSQPNSPMSWEQRGVATGAVCEHHHNPFHPRSGDDNDADDHDDTKPRFLPMVPWFTVTGADLWKTGIGLLIGLKLFLGRFDMRTLMAATDAMSCGVCEDKQCRHDGKTFDLRNIGSSSDRASGEGGGGGGGGGGGRRKQGGKNAHDDDNDNGAFWFDFMADTGDGGDSTYHVAKAMAQPMLQVDDGVTLHRGSVLVVGGDLAYPNPTVQQFDQRTFLPFEDAFPSPTSFAPNEIAYDKRFSVTANNNNNGGIAVDKPSVTTSVSSMGQGGPTNARSKARAVAAKEGDGTASDAKDGAVPMAFLIPGNHDYIDGLDAFLRCFCMRDWLGGWLMPQRSSYFALQLPHGWWILGLDLALVDDIDALQFGYFARVADTMMGPDDRVIVVTHVPTWLLKWYQGTGRDLSMPLTDSGNMEQLLRHHVGSRLAIRINGDIHNYMRFVPSPDAKGSVMMNHVEQLVVSGGGGAFLHPTHPFANCAPEGIAHMSSAFPAPSESRRMGMRNLLGFRAKNWRIDVLIGLGYFNIIASTLPFCQSIDPIFQAKGLTQIISAILAVGSNVIIRVFSESWLSLGAWLWTSVVCIIFAFGSGGSSTLRCAAFGLLHALTHIVAAVGVALLVEIGVSTCVRHGLLGGHGGLHRLWEWYSTEEARRFPDDGNARETLTRMTFGLYPGLWKWGLTMIDVPQALAVLREDVCSSGWAMADRGTLLGYYMSSFVYFWAMACPVGALVFGGYLAVAITVLRGHWDEAFSALQIEHFKSFLRCRVNSDGSLDTWVLGSIKTPTRWKRDPTCDRKPGVCGHMLAHPSVWRDAEAGADATWKVIDKFTVRRPVSA